MIAIAEKEHFGLNMRQYLTSVYYCEGETKGNLTASMKKAKYSKSYAEHNCDRLWRKTDFRKAVDDKLKAIDRAKNLTIETVNADFERAKGITLKKEDMSNYVRIVENQGKHVGYYAIDNAQKAEIAKLSQIEQIEADKIAQIRLIEHTKEVIIGRNTVQKGEEGQDTS